MNTLWRYWNVLWHLTACELLLSFQVKPNKCLSKIYKILLEIEQIEDKSKM